MDLFYRLNVFPVHVPPLRERVNDIPVLVDYFAARLAARTGKKITHVEKRSLAAMQQYSWPGNIRELQNVIERCVILADGEVLRVDPGMLLQDPLSTVRAVAAADYGSDRRSQIESVLRETRGKVYGPRGAAARLGLPATTLDSQLRTLGINKHQFK
jgi:formate hydrogenlyase transcriptional activator